MPRLGEIKRQVETVGRALLELRNSGGELEKAFHQFAETVLNVWPDEGVQVNDQWEPFEEIKEEFQGWVIRTQRAFSVYVMDEPTLLSEAMEMRNLLREFVRREVPTVLNKDAFDPGLENLLICSTENSLRAERNGLRAELNGLLRELEGLQLAQVQLMVKTVRRYTETRGEPAGQWVGGENRGQNRQNVANGLTVMALGPRTAEEALAAPLWRSVRTGEPIVNSEGQSLVIKPGWEAIHLTEAIGPHAQQAQAALEMANQWVVRRLGGWLGPMLWPGRGVRAIGGNIWPDVVDAVAEVAEDATLTPAEWSVEVGPGRSIMPVDMWRSRGQWSMGGEYTTEDEARIGDEPVEVMRVRDRMLADSRRAVEWLLRQLEPVAPGEQEIGRESVQQSAFKAVIESGMAGIMRVAASTKAGDQVSAIMRKRWEADPETKSWSADRWVTELGCAKKTIVGHKPSGVPPCNAWAERMAWKESNKQARKRNSVS